MRRIIALVLGVAIAVLLASGAAGAPLAPSAPAVGSYIVVLKDGVPDPGAVADRHAKEKAAAVSHVYRHALKGYAATVPNEQLESLRRDPDVLYVAEDIEMHASAPPPPAQQLPTGIDRVDADLSSTVAGDGAGSVDVDVAILDSGFDLSHPDLDLRRGAVCEGRDFLRTNVSHGTGVAGVVGAKDNAIGVVGVAPGARAWATKVFNDARGRGTVSTVICGVDWVTANANLIEVANMSILAAGSDDGDCGRTNQDPLHQAICSSVAAGVTYVVAAGNESRDASTTVPAAYDEVITVSALADFDGQPGGLTEQTCSKTPKGTFVGTPDDSFVFFSNHGADVDLIAPGVCIFTTVNRGGYDFEAGTSFSSPHVAGAAALYKASHPTASPAQVRAALIAAGTFDYDGSADPDGIKEPLVNVASF